MTNEKSLSSLKFTRFRRFSNWEATKKLKQIERLLLDTQVPHDFKPVLTFTILHPAQVKNVLAGQENNY